jgi:hypothetical protein
VGCFVAVVCLVKGGCVDGPKKKNSRLFFSARLEAAQGAILTLTLSSVCHNHQSTAEPSAPGPAWLK